jgi:hypothetical protein
VLYLYSHARLRVHLASGIPCALFYRAYEKFLQKLGRVASRDRGDASANDGLAV